MIEAVAVIVCLSAAGIVVFGLLPWAARVATTAAMYSARVDLYNIADRCPSIRQTLLYRDVEFYLCYGIQLLRDHRTLDIWKFLIDLERARNAKDPSMERHKLYTNEMARATAEQLEALQEAVGMTERVHALLSVRAILGSGPTLAIFVVSFIAIMPAWYAWQLTRETLETRALSIAVANASPGLQAQGT